MALLFCIIALAVVVALQNNLYRRHTFRNMRYRCYFSTDEAYEGDEIELVEELTNAKLLPIPWMKTDFTTSRWLDFAGTRSVVTDDSRFVASFFMLRSYHKVQRRWKVRCTRRGVFEIGRVSLVASDLLGNHVASKAVESGARITVLPDPLQLEDINYSPTRATGDVLVRRSLISDPFYIVGAREYMEGDPMNRIDWLATARTRQLMVHKNAFTASPSTAVLLNMQSREFERGKPIDAANIEDCIHVCAGLFYASLHDNIPVELLANSAAEEGTVSTGLSYGVGHVANLLRTLAALPPESSGDFSRWLAEEGPSVKATDVIIVSSYLNEGMLAYAEGRPGVKFIIIGYADPKILPPDCEAILLFDLLKRRKERHETESSSAV